MKSMDLLPEETQLNKVSQSQIDKKHFKLFSCTLPFLHQKNNPKRSIFTVFFTSKKTLVASFNETRALASRKCVVQKGLPTPNLSKVFQIFQLKSSLVALEKQPGKLNLQSFFTFKKHFGDQFHKERLHLLPEKMQLNKFYLCKFQQKVFKLFGGTSPFLLQKNILKSSILRVFLPLRNPLVASSNEASAPTSSKNVVEHVLGTPNSEKIFQTFWSLFSICS